MGVMHIPGHTHQAPREVALEEIEAVLGDCHLCQLYQSRHNIVFGVGNPRAQRAQVPPAGKPQSASRGSAGLLTVFARADSKHLARYYRDAR